MVLPTQKCPLCEARKAKRFCPAKLVQICPVCCGTKREVEIDCISDCVYLQAGREYENRRTSRQESSPPFTQRLWSQNFRVKHYVTLVGLWSKIHTVRSESPTLVDGDVREVINQLIRTYQTQAEGIYFDHAPNTLTQKTLYGILKSYLEEKQNQQDLATPTLKTNDLLDCLQLSLEMAGFTDQSRPKSRAFLDQLGSIVAEANQKAHQTVSPSGIVLP